MYDFKMKPTISFKFPNGSHELIYNLRTRLAAVSHLEWNKGPVSRFAESSGQCPKVIAFEMSNKYCCSLLITQESINLWVHMRPPQVAQDIVLYHKIKKNDTAILAQGSTINYVIHTLQKGLNNIEKWCTLWRVAINTDKTHAVMFRKDDKPTYLPSYLPTFRSHLKYNTEKFWAKVHLLIPLIGRRSPLTLENKLLLFKQVLRPILTYAAQIWGLAAFSNRKKAQILQKKILRIIVNAPWYVRNSVIHNDLNIQTIDEFIKELSRNFFHKLVNHTNPTVLDQLHNNGKYAFPYATTKWSTPLKPP
ncbi:putative RNA-directed DNA polymerase from transposon BS [Araneus ventricosus]|uniref:Putative RNA-directed DNA polymerase from transposon BS n=1 Tax=Araneus ventricosus TaxID=182803 RepID=A0A4Y2E049_ARAVE|nr:putative RNA-directed DNA polymerase from transposon BS [Araneus ventricosus]